MIPIIMPDELKTTWTHQDCFNDEPFNYARAFTHKSYSIGMHTHNFYEVNIVLKGKGRHFIENNYVDVHEGCVFVIPPQIKHAYYNIDNLDVFHILLSNAFITNFNNELKNLPGYSILFEIEPFLRSEFKESLFLILSHEQMNKINIFIYELLKFQDIDYSGKHILINTASLQIIGMLCSYIGQTKFAAKEKKYYQHIILLCMEYINKNCKEKIAIYKLAQSCNMSRSTFLRNFNSICRCTPMKYLFDCRMKLAKYLLISTSLTVSQISQECGFFDTAHFNKTFKKYFKTNPTYFKSENIDKPAAML